MRGKMTGIGLALAFGVAGAAHTAIAQDWSDNFESYSNGQVLYNVGGWSGWDDDPAVAGSCTTARARGGTKSILVELTDDAIHEFTGYTTGAGTITAWVYIPISEFVADAFFLVQNDYVHGGPYEWCIDLQFDFDGGGVVVDDFRPETNTPSIVFDQWVEVRCEVDIDNDTITCYYNNIEVSTGQLFIRGGSAELANLDLYTTGTTCYYDDISFIGFGGGGGYTCTVTGSCPGTVNVAWENATPNRQQGIVFASNTGSFSIPSGPCQGTVLGLGSRNLRLVNTVGTGNGSGSVNGQAGSGACGGYLQLVTVANPCVTSTVDQIP